MKLQPDTKPQQTWRERFDEQFGSGNLFREEWTSIGSSDLVDATQDIKAFLATEIKAAEERGAEKERERTVEALESLCDMWMQYCPPPYTHMFMRAGEGAEQVLDDYGLLKRDRNVDWDKLKALTKKD